MVLDAFIENVAEIEHYNIYYNNSIFGNKKTGYSILPTSGNIPRGNYYYAVSSGALSGEESTAARIRVDSRWWGGVFNGYIALKWSETPGTELYHIYRGTSEDSLYYLSTIPGNLFIDSNGLTEVNYDREPLLFNYTSLIEPSNLEIYNDIHTVNFNMRLKKPNWLTIIIYLNGNTLLPQIHIDRLQFLFSKLIAPEIRYNIIIAGSKYILYNWEPINIDVTYFYCDGNLETGVYLLSNNARNGIASDEYMQYLLGTTTYGTGLYGITALFESRIYNVSNTSKVFNIFTFMFNCDLGRIELFYRKDYYSEWSTAVTGTGETEIIIEGGIQSVQFLAVFKSISWNSGDSIYYLNWTEI
jgi:hypothetical protein